MNDHQHSIRLGTAWEPPASVDNDGRVLWTRHFGRPGGLGPADRVLLVVVQPAVSAEMTVNAVALPPLSAHVGRWAQDITPLLRDRNELHVTVAASVGHDSSSEPPSRGPLPSVIGMVTLEIVAGSHAAIGSADA
jgi:hypothetical protein